MYNSLYLVENCSVLDCLHDLTMVKYVNIVVLIGEVLVNYESHTVDTNLKIENEE